MFTEKQINEILAVCEKATPGPWDSPQYGFSIDCDDHGLFHAFGSGEQVEHDMQFVCQARTLLPALAAEYKAMLAVVEAAKGIEWVYGGDNLEGMWLLCPCCGKGEIDGHNDDCKLHQALVAAGYGGED